MLPPPSKRNVRADERLARVGYVTVTVHTCVHMARVRRAAGVHVALIRAGVHVARVRRATRLLGSGRASTWHSSERASTWRDRSGRPRGVPIPVRPDPAIICSYPGTEPRPPPTPLAPTHARGHHGGCLICANGARARGIGVGRAKKAAARGVGACWGRAAPDTWHVDSAPEAQPARRRRRDHTPRLARARALL